MNTSGDLLGYVSSSSGARSRSRRKEKGKEAARENGWYNDGGGLNEEVGPRKTGTRERRTEKRDHNEEEKKKAKNHHHHQRKQSAKKIPFHSHPVWAWRKKPTNPIPIRIPKLRPVSASTLLPSKKPGGGDL
jgi:hypothetical protein